MRIASIDIPDKKRIVIALTYIFGIGSTTAKKLLKECQIDENLKTQDLTNEQRNAIQKYISDSLMVEGDKRREVNSHISRLISISCYRGIRHREGLPVRGQRTRNKGGKRRDRRRKRAIAA